MNDGQMALTRRHRRDELNAAMQQHPQREEPRGMQSLARRPHRRNRTSSTTSPLLKASSCSHTLGMEEEDSS